MKSFVSLGPKVVQTSEVLMQLGIRKVERLLHPGPVLSKQYQHPHLAVVQTLCLCIFVLKNQCRLT